MEQEFKVEMYDKVIKLKGDFVGNIFCVDSSSIDNHPELNSEEKESLKRYLRSDKSLFIE